MCDPAAPIHLPRCLIELAAGRDQKRKRHEHNGHKCVDWSEAAAAGELALSSAAESSFNHFIFVAVAQQWNGSPRRRRRCLRRASFDGRSAATSVRLSPPNGKRASARAGKHGRRHKQCVLKQHRTLMKRLAAGRPPGSALARTIVATNNCKTWASTQDWFD
jgi:hypothetical protein